MRLCRPLQVRDARNDYIETDISASIGHLIEWVYSLFRLPTRNTNSPLVKKNLFMQNVIYLSID